MNIHKSLAGPEWASHDLSEFFANCSPLRYFPCTKTAAAFTPPDITARAYDDDGQSKPVMITAWIHAIKLLKTLLDGDSLVELMSRRMLNQIHLEYAFLE